MRTHRKRLVIVAVLAIMVAALLASLGGCEQAPRERSGGAEDPVVEDVNE